ncbi:hypothetical protein LINPERPRIM_LOCUS33573 [Linum perenne]
MIRRIQCKRESTDLRNQATLQSISMIVIAFGITRMAARSGLIEINWTDSKI